MSAEDPKTKNIDTAAAPTTAPCDARLTMDLAARAAARLLNQLRRLNFSCFEPITAAQAVEPLERGPVAELTRVLDAAMQLVHDLQAVVEFTDGAKRGANTDATEVMPLMLLSSTRRPLADAPGDWVNGPIEGVAQPPQDWFCEELDASVKQFSAMPVDQAAQVQRFVAVCRRTLLMLDECRHLLGTAQRLRSKWAMITAGEEGRHKARKSLRAVLMMGVQFLAQRGAARVEAAPHGLAELLASDGPELQTALQVRVTVMEFRRDVLVLTDTVARLGDMDVGLLMHDVRGRFLQLFGERTYADLRAADRFALQRMCAKVNDWLNGVWDHFDAARQILFDVRACASGLENINHRAILVQHDREVKQDVLARLQSLATSPPSTSSEGWHGLSGALRETLRMEWRSARLDILVKEELTHGADSVAEVQSRAGALAEALAAAAVV